MLQRAHYDQVRAVLGFVGKGAGGGVYVREHVNTQFSNLIANRL